MKDIKPILLAEDSPADAEMAIDALREANLANPIVHVEDGVETMEYLLREGRFADREPGDPSVLLLDIKMPRMDGLEAVSYTHLDVYKRQSPPCSRHGRPIGATRSCKPCLVTCCRDALRSVSPNTGSPIFRCDNTPRASWTASHVPWRRGRSSPAARKLSLIHI